MLDYNLFLRHSRLSGILLSTQADSQGEKEWFRKDPRQSRDKSRNDINREAAIANFTC